MLSAGCRGLGPASGDQEGVLRSELVCLEQHLSEDVLQQEVQEGKEGLGRRVPILPGTEGNARRLGTQCRNCLWG